MSRNTWLAVAILLCASLPARSEPLVFETQSLRLAIAEDGTVQSLVSLPDGTEYVREDARIPFATVYRGGRSVPSSQKKYGEAFVIWTKVLEIYPEAKETRAKVNELAPTLEAEARRLYAEGLVYQGLGNMETARERWREAMAAMPLQDNEYYRKSAAKLGIATGAGATP